MVVDTVGNELEAQNIEQYILVDWDRDGDYDDPYEDITADVLVPDSGSPPEIVYGRDTNRSLSPPVTNKFTCEVNNEDGTYTNQFPGSPLYGVVQKGAPGVVDYEYGVDVPFNDTETFFNDDNTLFNGRKRTRLFTGKLWEPSEQGGIGQYINKMTFLGMSQDLVQNEITTQQVYTMIPTDQVIHLILDEINWPLDKRIIYPGSTIFTYWWAEKKSIIEAITTVLLSEGGGAALYETPNGEIVFQGRAFRDTNPRSLVSQATFSDTVFGIDPTFNSTAVMFNDPDVLFNGLPRNLLYYTSEPTVDDSPENVINDITAQINVRTLLALLPVWSLGQSFTLGANESRDFWPSASDLFQSAVLPVAGTDFTVTAGALAAVGGVTMSALSGQTVKITIKAGASGATMSGLQLRARLLQTTSKTTLRPSLAPTTTQRSRDHYGQMHWSYPMWPEIEFNTAQDLVNGYILRNMDIRPKITMTVAGVNARTLRALIDLQISDRITIINERRGIATDAWIESVRHRILGRNLLETTFGCESVYQNIVARWERDRWDASSTRWGI